MKMIKEFCAENFTNIPNAITAGATRIELCDNLAVGGTTPSIGVIKETLQYTEDSRVPVMTIIRPRGGNFIYNDTELKIMETDLFETKNLGAYGVVLGCLTEKNWLDEEAMEQLIEAAEGLQITFHMAFDLLNQADQLKAIDWLADHGVSRILTHGGQADTLIEENIPWLKELINYANNKLIILPGGGITKHNLPIISKQLSVSEFHGTKIV
ncbi:CutC-like protein [Melissococcus plutonius]|uniref:PF03932 family protein CutC n=3 Tax=Melissococcus plutonius TaxID=33970 RepID=F3Y9Y3_MELPT|nr:CutC-like protein [Melissococcus plutonius S1]KMT24956.1 CutC-like protein [Melissococcus plutonius]BAK21311.1 cytoplasmic copper homeostasis protein CutC [Melissococcus plutonius ATCC 35311]BAL62313.1 cytoplasmic copper homeostasis protein CutC [Melissococcus plutonius DAT561]KMT26593.1 CutC-like protein [Melissococcus plutonius]